MTCGEGPRHNFTRTVLPFAGLTTRKEIAAMSQFSLCGGYLETESSRDTYTSCCVGSLNNSGITVKECVGHSGLKSHSANISWSMGFEERRPRLWMVVGS